MPRSRPVSARLFALGALALVAAAAAYLVFARGDSPPGPRGALQDYLAAWNRGDDRGAGALTDRPRTATAALRANRAGLDGARVHATIANVDEHGDRASAAVRVRWRVPSIGDYGYRTTITLRRQDGDWRIAWRPTAIHPRLTNADRRLGTVRAAPPRAPIQGRDGT
ncbi:MAG TPA: NTF2-like N-terminal transpeptidase domain-containing protein, partial [Solirubrobacteraceae bacterium]|nr:NTF2-like N-terminal transpeptidase domain-containing protein [Solirubrobacteraceae bacterium]